MKRIALVLLFLVACTHASAPLPQDVVLQIPGTIYGKVIAKDGSVLPGVNVTLDKATAFVTDAQGAFRFLAVPSGKHTLRAELPGYGTSTRVVTIAASAGLQTTLMLNPSVSESIVVTAETPILDRRSSGTTTSISLNDPAPASREPWTVMQKAPALKSTASTLAAIPTTRRTSSRSPRRAC